MTMYKRDTRKKQHILLADDEGPLRRSLKLILRQAGFKVTAVQDGQMALKTILDLEQSSENVDLLMTDLQMNGLTGMELIEELNVRRIRIPVLVITGFGNKDVVVQLLRKGCVEYIDKPLDPYDVLSRVERLMLKEQQALMAEPQQIEPRGQDVHHMDRELDAYRGHLSTLTNKVSADAVALHELIHLQPEGCKVKVAYRYQSLVELGGSFADIRNTETGCDIFLANVEGHDLDTSYYAILLKAFFEENCRRLHNGHTFFQLLNRQLLEKGNKERRVTGLFVRIDLEGMAMDVVAAGHPSPIKIKQIVPVPIHVSVRGDSLGVHNELALENRSFMIAPGERIFLFSKEFSTAAGAESVAGTAGVPGGEHIGELIGNTLQPSLDQHVAAVWDKVMACYTGLPDDDMVLIGVEIPR